MIECYHTEVRKGKNILRKKKKWLPRNSEIKPRLLFFLQRGEICFNNYFSYQALYDSNSNKHAYSEIK